MIAELEKLAREATPGPWLTKSSLYARVGCESVAKGDGSTFIADCDGDSGRVPQDAKNAAYIAAANPAAVLKLIAVVRAAERVLERWDSRDWKEAPTADYMNALRQALAEVQQ